MSTAAPPTATTDPAAPAPEKLVGRVDGQLPDNHDRPTGGWVGRSLPRREDRRLLTGRGRFTDDTLSVDLVYCALVRSPHAHARVVAVNTAAALALPGVVAVVTGAEAKEHWEPFPATWDSEFVRVPRNYPLAVDRVRYQGEPVAAVLADSRYTAEDAAVAVQVDYEPLPVVATAADAIGGPAGPAVKLYDEWPGNVQCDWPFIAGDVDGGFDRAELVVRDTYSSQRYSTMPLETRAVHAAYDEVERQLTVHLSTQIPHHARSQFAHVFGLPESNIRVVAADVGGGFGGKLALDVEYVPVLMAILAGRPVRWVETRSEWIAAGPHARDFTAEVEAAFTADGRLLALRNRIVADMGCDGAERAGGLGMPVMAGTYMPSGYRLDAYSMDIRCVVTNKAPYGACRGYGKDIANLGIERVMDRAALALDLTGVEIRRRNLTDSYPHPLVTGPVIESGSLRQCLDRLEQVMDLPGLRRRQVEARAQGRYLGFAAASWIEPSGGSIPNSMYQNNESATVRVLQDGTVRVFTGIQSIGQGIQTSLALVAADRLGCHPDDVLVSWGDTESSPFGLGAYSARGASYGVEAVVAAADKVRVKVLSAAAALLETTVEQLVVDADGIRSGDGGGRPLSLADVAYAVYFHPGAQAVLSGVADPSLEATATWRHPSANWNPDALGRVQLYTSHPGGAQGALVEVDVETGQVRVEKVWMVADHGTLIHPPSVTGQIVGGTVQQLGGTLYENVAYDPQGNLLTHTLGDYGLPNIFSAPPVEVEHLQTPTDATVVGAKGVGESGCIATTTVLLAAAEDALRPLGVMALSSPLSPWRVLEAIDHGQRAP